MENSKNQNPIHDVTTPRRLVVKVLQDVTAKQTFETYADLAEALKARCAKLKIPYHAGLVTEAIAQLEQGAKKPLIPLPEEKPRGRPPLPEGQIISATDALRIVAALQEHFPQLRVTEPEIQKAPVGFPRLRRVK